MRLRSLPIALLLAAVAGSLCSCRSLKRKNAATAVGTEFFEKFSVPDEATENEWGMTDYVVFEPEGIFGTDDVEAEKTAESPEEYEVIISFWCKGTDLQGESVKRRRELCITVVAPEEGGPFQMKGHELRVDEPLGFMRQAGTWLGYSFLALLFLLFCCGLGRSEVGYGIAGLLSISISGYFAYTCFRSGWAVPLGIIVYVILGALLVGLIAAIGEARS